MVSRIFFVNKILPGVLLICKSNLFIKAKFKSRVYSWIIANNFILPSSSLNTSFSIWNEVFFKCSVFYSPSLWNTIVHTSNAHRIQLWYSPSYEKWDCTVYTFNKFTACIFTLFIHCLRKLKAHIKRSAKRNCTCVTESKRKLCVISE